MRSPSPRCVGACACRVLGTTATSITQSGTTLSEHNSRALCHAHDLLQPSKEATSLVSEWKGKKAETEQTLKLLQAYKALGDSKAEVRPPCGAAMAGRGGAGGDTTEAHSGVYAQAPDVGSPVDSRGCGAVARTRAPLTHHPRGHTARPPCCPRPSAPRCVRPFAQPLLKNHNPRTFEDLTAPVPNFRAMALKPGEVGKFFDNVLAKRADDAVQTVRRGGLLPGAGSWRPWHAPQPGASGGIPGPP